MKDLRIVPRRCTGCMRCELDSPLQDGDRITLAGQSTGG